MRFVPVKTPEQQAGLVLHRTRDLLVRQRTMLINALRGHLAEFGVVAAQGPQNGSWLYARAMSTSVATPGRNHCSATKEIPAVSRCKRDML